MKIAIISDIHANIFGLKTVFSSLPQVDRIFCAGDITGYYPFVNEVISELRDKNVTCIKGNHDQYLIDNKAPENSSDLIKKSVEITKKIISSDNLNFLKSLPDHLEMVIDQKKIMMFHASPWNYLEERVYPDYPDFDRFKTLDADMVILGHTHYPFIKVVDNLIIVNPGSCGQPRDFNLLSYMLWNTQTNEFVNKRAEWDISGFIKEAKKRGSEDDLFEVFKRMKK